MIVALQCRSDAFHSARFVWKKDGRVVHQGALYSVSNANLSHAGEYICEASNAARDATMRTNVELLCKYSKKERLKEVLKKNFAMILYFNLSSVDVLKNQGFVLKSKKNLW